MIFSLFPMDIKSGSGAGNYRYDLASLSDSICISPSSIPVFLYIIIIIIQKEKYYSF